MGNLGNPFEGVVQGNYCMKVAQEDYGTSRFFLKLEEAEDVISVEQERGYFRRKKGRIYGSEELEGYRRTGESKIAYPGRVIFCTEI